MARVIGLGTGAGGCVIDECSQINLQRLHSVVWDPNLRLGWALAVPRTIQMRWIHCFPHDAIYRSRSRFQTMIEPQDRVLECLDGRGFFRRLYFWCLCRIPGAVPQQIAAWVGYTGLFVNRVEAVWLCRYCVEGNRDIERPR